MTAPRSTASPTSDFNVTIRAEIRGLISTRSEETSPWTVSGGGLVASQSITPNAETTTTPTNHRTVLLISVHPQNGALRHRDLPNVRLMLFRIVSDGGSSQQQASPTRPPLNRSTYCANNATWNFPQS